MARRRRSSGVLKRTSWLLGVALAVLPDRARRVAGSGCRQPGESTVRRTGSKRRMPRARRRCSPVSADLAIEIAPGVDRLQRPDSSVQRPGGVLELIVVVGGVVLLDVQVPQRRGVRETPSASSVWKLCWSRRFQSLLNLYSAEKRRPCSSSGCRRGRPDRCWRSSRCWRHHAPK